MVPFAESQYKKIHHILKKNAGCDIYKKHLIHHLRDEDVLETLHSEFASQVPAYRRKDYYYTLQRELAEKDLSDVQVMTTPNLIAKDRPYAFATSREHYFPVSEDMLRNFLKVQREFYDGTILGIEAIKGLVFSVYETPHIDVEDGMRVSNFHALAASIYKKALFKKGHFCPEVKDLLDTGKSRYQRLHIFLTALEERGEAVEAIIAQPQTLLEMKMLLSQREGRNVSLKEICPNLKLYIHYGAPVTSYQRELQEFFDGMHPHYLEMYFHPSGALATQVDAKLQKELALRDDLDVFYEFVPEEDVDASGHIKRNARRLHAGKVREGERYLLLVTNGTGLLAHNTEDIVEVVSKEPFHIIYRGLAEKLNYFGEAIALDMMEEVIAEGNDTLQNYGFLIREYMIADDFEHKEALWIFELDQPVMKIQEQVLQSLANTLNTEMELRNARYRHAVRGSMALPKMVFVSMGTFSATHADSQLMHIDTSEGAYQAKYVLSQASERRTFKPQET